MALDTFDPGELPGFLEPLTWMEEMLLAPYRPLHRILYCRPYNAPSWQSHDTFAKSMCGHVVAVPSTGPHQLTQLLPCSIDELPKHITVVLLSPVSNVQHAKQLLKKCSYLQVRVCFAC